MSARVFMRQQRALLRSLSLSLLMMMMMMQKRVSAIDKRTQSEERGFRDHHFSTANGFYVFPRNNEKSRYVAS